jgi:hypothetical protein
VNIIKTTVICVVLLSISSISNAQKDLTKRHSHETAMLEIKDPVGSANSSGSIKVTSLEEEDCDNCVFTYTYDTNTKVVLRKSGSEVDPSQLHRFKNEIAQVYADGEGYIWMIGFSGL